MSDLSEWGKVISDLSEWGKVIREMGSKRQSEHDELNRLLGEPDLLEKLPVDPELPQFNREIGYWRIRGGIMTYHRYVGKQWDPHSRCEYTDATVSNLASLLEKTPRLGK